MSEGNLKLAAPTKRRRTSEEVRRDERLVRRIRAALDRDPRAVVRALELLFAAQENDEKAAGVTRHNNGVGFSQADARLGTWLVTIVIADGRAKGIREIALLRGKALEMGRRIAHKYARTQLLKAAKEKQAEREYMAALAAFEAERRADEERACVDDEMATLGEPKF